ncbi:MAG: hypothetical protein NVS9B15_21610 [Acidobacteriaceae bacterium]
MVGILHLVVVGSQVGIGAGLSFTTTGAMEGVLEVARAVVPLTRVTPAITATPATTVRTIELILFSMEG